MRTITQALIVNEDVPEDAFRNFYIELRYHELIEKGSRPKDARFQVSDEFFLCEKRIQQIIYKK